MNIHAALDQFWRDNPQDVDTQAKRLLASGNRDLILYVLTLGLTTAKQRQRHHQRNFIKNFGVAPPKNLVLVSGIMPSSKKVKRALTQLICDVWMIGPMRLGDATGNDLAVAIKRETSSMEGHLKNAEFYRALKERVGEDETVREKWSERALRDEIRKVFGEFWGEAMTA